MSNVIIVNNNIHELVRIYLTNKQQLPTQLSGLPIGKWDVSNVTSMKELFNGYENFDEPLIEWDVYNVTDMSKMFAGCSKFNQPLSDELYNWAVHNVTDMSEMFSGCTNFNQSLTNWNVSNVTNMNSMFAGNSSFNQNINNWNVSGVSSMISVFENSTSFNQPLSGWNVSNVTNMTEMLNSSDLNTSNYDNLLISWSGLTLQTGVTFGVLSLTYTSGGAADSARSYIQSTYNWTFVGDSSV